MNFSPYFPHFWSVLGYIRYNIIYVHTIINMSAFREDRVTESCTSVMGAIKITQTRAPSTI